MTEAWVVFEDDDPVFIDAILTEAQMRSWYRNQLSEGYTLRRVKLVDVQEGAEPETTTLTATEKTK